MSDGGLEGQGRHGLVARDRTTGRSDVTSVENVHKAATSRTPILHSPSTMAVASRVPTTVNLGLRVPTSPVVVFSGLASSSALATILAGCYNLGSYCLVSYCGLSARVAWLNELSDRVMPAFKLKTAPESLAHIPDDIAK